MHNSSKNAVISTDRSEWRDLRISLTYAVNWVPRFLDFASLTRNDSIFYDLLFD